MKVKRFVITCLMAWLVFIMIDFVMHASILADMWLENEGALKELTDLAVLIPAGYLSFLILTVLTGWVYTMRISSKEEIASSFKFGLQFSFLFSSANFLGIYSYIDIPAKTVFLMSFVYFVELISVVVVFNYLYFAEKIKSKIWILVLIVFLGLVIGIVYQNILGTYDNVG